MNIWIRSTQVGIYVDEPYSYLDPNMWRKILCVVKFAYLDWYAQVKLSPYATSEVEQYLRGV